MNINIDDNLKRVIILDVSGVYIQIYNQGYFSNTEIANIEKKHCNKQHWRILIL